MSYFINRYDKCFSNMFNYIGQNNPLLSMNRCSGSLPDPISIKCKKQVLKRAEKL